VGGWEGNWERGREGQEQGEDLKGLNVQKKIHREASMYVFRLNMVDILLHTK